MDTITFTVGDTTIQLIGDQVLIWVNDCAHEPDAVLPLRALQDALSTASLLRRT